MHRILICLLLTCLGSLKGDVPEGFVQRTWTIQGSQRTALLRVPKPTPGNLPVLFCWHGHGGTAEHAARAWDLPSAWPEALLVYPQGLPTPGQLTDPEGRRTGWQSQHGAQNDRDLEFFDTLLAALLSEFPVDQNQIYSTGHSNGGGFCYLLWSQRPDILAAIAPVAATLGRKTKPNTPLPVLHVAGREDRLVKFSWQQATFEAIRALNQCSPTPAPWGKSGPLTAELFVSQKAAPLVTALHSGGHEYPAGTAKLVVRFCKENQRRSRPHP
jgi:polyhydroxybutyrate depolymerase